MTASPLLRITCLATTLLSTACTGLDPAASPQRKETVHAVTHSHRLVSFNAGRPELFLSDRSLAGLAHGEQVLGIDYRVARGELYALTSAGRVGRIEVASGQFMALGEGRLPLEGERFGFDFNPSADRIRIVSDARQNLRVHPDTGAQVDFNAEQPGMQPDGTLTYADGDVQYGNKPEIAAAGYTYNKNDEKLTTNFAIDIARGSLVRQGSIEGEKPVVSPNSGKLYTVGRLGVADIADAHFDIADLDNTALAVFSTAADPAPRLHVIDLTTGRATPVGKVGKGEPLRGIAIEP